MIKIGMVDRWLDNWHTNHYPDYLRLAAKRYGVDIDITTVWAWQDAPEGMTTKEWCKAYGVREAKSYEALLEEVDGIMVMCADDCTPHEELAEPALRYGKPVYCDKTFAPDLDTAKRMFALAETYGTPVFSCSAQRYVMELQSYVRKYGQTAEFCSTTGPGDLKNYSIHQFEMVEYAMGIGAKSCCSMPCADGIRLLYTYKDGRMACVEQSNTLPFVMTLCDGKKMEDIAVTDYYMALMYALCCFFQNRIPPVAKEDTLEIMAMQQSAREALKHPGKPVPVPH